MRADDSRHGDRKGYFAHRADGEDPCLPCAAANARYERRRRYDAELGRPRLLPNVGTRRRIQALVAIGWCYKDLGIRLNLALQNVYQIANDRELVRIDTAQRVAALFEELCMTPAPPGRSASIARTVARKRGWPPPLAWDDIDNDPEPPKPDRDEDIDPVVVMRLLEGKSVPSTRAEREEAIRRWVADGGTKTELCNHHGWAPDRYGAALRVIQGGAA